MPSKRSRIVNKMLWHTVRKHLVRADNIPQMREASKVSQRFPVLSPKPRGLRRTPTQLGKVPCEWLDMPNSSAERTILYLHGGGFCFSAFPGQYAMMGRLCRRLEARALMPDYRLAPEYPFPAAPQDCFAVYQALLERDVDPRTVVLVGDSAGGNLVMTTLLQIKDAGLPLPAGGIVISPCTDGEQFGKTERPNMDVDPFFDLSVLNLFAESYLQGADITDPLLSPLQGDLSGLPPLMIQVGELEILLEDSVKLADKARADGVDVTLHRWPGLPHVFPAFPVIPEAVEALDQMAQFAERCIEHALTTPRVSNESSSTDQLASGAST